MHLLTSFLFLLAFIGIMVNADSTESSICKNKYCFITTNSDNEQVLNCTTEKVEDDLIQCSYFPDYFKLKLSTKNNTYVKIDKIEPGAFQRLVSGVIVKKVHIKNILFPQLDSRDFEGLRRITEIRLENPKVLAQDTFLKMTFKSHIFVLLIACNEENKKFSFNELHFRGYFAVHSFGCQNSLICETVTRCNATNEYPLYKVMSTNQTSSPRFYLGHNHCTEKSDCSQKEKKKEINPPKVVSQKVSRPALVTSIPKSKSAKLVTTSKSENYYDTLMWVVLWLTGINSIVIMGILLFLIIWLKRMSTSAANKKHTIILEDEDNTKYLKLTPYA